MFFRNNKSLSGFTLVELAIVIVIIGLLVGGVMQGQALIEAAKVRKVITDVRKISQAVNTFYSKYDAIPGDMRKASIFFPSCVDYDSNPCNGNGDKVVVRYTETIRFWQHLYLANMHNFASTGQMYGSTQFGLNAGVNIPTSPLDGAAYWIYDNAVNRAPSGVNGTNRVSFGAWLWNGGYDAPGLTSEQAFQIDEKMDDGKPGLGKVSASGVNCANPNLSGPGNTMAPEAVYVFTDNNKNCVIDFFGLMPF
jgi:prepilin-type N-terminal cleavage/methylation domain-containing protein